MFNDTVAKAIIEAADHNKIEPACLLALVEVETGGALFETDGRTPQLLYERHVAWREASKISQRLLAAFRSAGLAIPRWDKATQYRDERTSAQRLQLIRRARAINEETADRSASWGLGQTMGFLAGELGFGSAVEMVGHMEGSMAGQIDCMIRELRHSHLIDPLNDHDWRHVARIYNGPGYEANRYDVRLGDAYKRWTRKVSVVAQRDPPPEQSLGSAEVLAIQEELRDLGYAEVGDPDGVWGTRTTGALSAFQSHEGIKVTGHLDDVTKSALRAALPRPVSSARADATADDLKEDGSTTIAHADHGSLIGKLTAGAGAAAAAGQSGALDKVKDLTDQVSVVQSVYNSLEDIGRWAFSHWWIAAIVAGVVITILASKIKKARLTDHQTGVHSGPTMKD